MKITPKNLKKHELIGLKAKVEESTNKSQIGIRGEVVDETQKTINISGKTISKKDSTFIFTLPDKKRVRVKGEVINSSPEERIKN
ncbi:ribonuclease P [archaeon SCG-AAA382B04]|nr:ribonuclease P [archaeon SCG-AAA382B04]